MLADGHEMVPPVRTAGFRPIEITDAYAEVDGYPQGFLPFTRPAGYLTRPQSKRRSTPSVLLKARF